MFLVDTKQKKITIWERLKNIKHFEIIIVVVFCAILLLIYSSTFSSTKSEKNTLTALTTEEYAEYLENKLSNVLSQINGAGNVSVMVTLACGVEYVYATNATEETTSQTNNGVTTTQTTTTEEIILVSQSGKDSPLVIKENLPKVSGVLIVSSGASNISVMLELQKAVMALLEINAEDIEILVGK